MEVFVQFSRMEVRDELVQFPWNTVGTQTIGLSTILLSTILGIKNSSKDNDSLEVFKLWKDVHMPETVNRYHWKILREKEERTL